MSWTRFFLRRYWDKERARELEAYLEIETGENIARGMSPEEARYAAQRKLGNTTLIREEIYHMNNLRWLEAIWQDLHYGLRMMVKNPAFAAVAVITLALGIGANTAIFTVIDAVLLKPLPYPDPGKVVWVTEFMPQTTEFRPHSGQTSCSHPNTQPGQRSRGSSINSVCSRSHAASI